VARTILRERIPSTDPRLRRHIHHDSESWRYPFPTAGLSIQSVTHTRLIPVLDQGQVGSCTGNAGIGCLGTDPYYASLREDVGKQLGAGTTGVYPLDEAGAVRLYSDAEVIDGDGPYPPNDNGSSGLSIARVLKAAGEIAGYTHTFTPDDALKALTVTPFITGVSWYEGMFTPDDDGRVHPTGRLAGGHEFVADQLDAELGRVWFTNSWGTSWGLGGRFYLTFGDYGDLLADQGDVTIFTPLTAPAPVPTPVPGDPDTAFAAALHHHDWIHHPHIATTAHVAAAAREWLAKKGL
jgi:hypothetical protein